MNFGTQAQADTMTQQSLVNLGQRVANAIETHSAAQAAQNMLPSIQSQISQGLQKVARGDSSGLSDVYGAAMTASRNPLLAPMANKAINIAQSANIQAQHMARTQAYLGGRAVGNMSAHPEMYNPDGTLNTSRLGQPVTPKGKATTVSDLKNANEMDSKLADQASQALRLGDQQSYDSAMQQRQSLRDQFPNITLPAISGSLSNFDTASQLSDAQKALKEEKAKGTGHWFRGNTDPNKVQSLQNQIKQLQGSGASGAIPAMKGNATMQLPTGKTIDNATFQKAIQYLHENPDTADQFESTFGLPKGTSKQILDYVNKNAPKQTQASPDVSQPQQEVAQTNPESADESEAVGGTNEEEPTSSDQNRMVA